ncbi:MBL fold metallo-hydrolase [Photobacterium aphoticum]|uniref:Beta-lactamase n=1 Tax=Photobacterium aphoticum TaxID=754436 RepID=A0A0J1JE26_9GAMM|nr:MBL fold metallo-hydrolase [Photobacterium aphoticum]KLU99906.1 beta-lactamase [Photobacterium aphoticum]PSU56851.1 MBL fold metallo-hydrolase [Photobacterium aphoticum]GHA40958.1 MBL fold metallo-hydrolase [Photobacterium aphoticum]
MSFIQSFGAAETVTGSCHFLQLDNGPNILIDCGYFQGENEEQTYAPFDFDPNDVDIVLLTHGHLDHVGRVPKLVKEGFDGRLIALRATMDLAEVILKDSAKIAEEDYKTAMKKARRVGGEKQIPPPIYTSDDVKAVFDLIIQYANYNRAIKLTPDVTVTFRNAGHILGSATLQIDINEDGHKKTLVFSGDLGSRRDLIMTPPDTVTTADALYIESTYGDRDHSPLDETITEFKDIIINTLNNRGNVLIPSFAVERTQEVLLLLKEMYYDKELPPCKVYLDSPMAIRATQIYNHYHAELNDTAQHILLRDGAIFEFPYLQYSLKNKDSMRINKQEEGCIIIAGSGMCTGGRILHHFKHRLWDERNSVIFVGFQVQGSLGRQLIDGAESIQIFNETINVNAQIHTLNGFSAHADQTDLLAWMSEFEQLGKVYLIHGEAEKQAVFKGVIQEQLDKPVHIVKYGEKVYV